MPLRLTCSNCGKSYQVRNELVGRTVKCRCGQPVKVGSNGSESEGPVVVTPPAPRVATQDIRRSRNKMGMWVTLGSLLAFSILVAVVYSLAGNGDPPKKETTEKSNPPRRERRSRDAGEKQVAANPANDLKEETVSLKPEEIPQANPKPADLPVIQADWKVPVDPSASAWQLPAGPSLGIAPRGNLIYHTDMFGGPNSPYVTMFKNFLGDQHLAVYDLRDGSEIADFPVKGMYSDNFSASPGGKYVTTIQQDPLQGVVHSLETQQVVATFALRFKRMSLDFLDENRLLLLEENQTTFRVIRVSNGEIEREITLGFTLPFRNRYVLTPGRKSLAIVDPKAKGGRDVVFFDLNEGGEIGRIHIPMDGHFGGQFDVAFSQDGKEFAVFAGDHRVRIWCFDVAAGALKESIQVPKSERRNVGNLHDHVRRTYRGKRLLFTPDGNGWLLQGHIFLDRNQKTLSWEVPYSGISGYTGPYRFVGDTLLLAQPDRQAIRESKSNPFWLISWPPKNSPE